MFCYDDGLYCGGSLSESINTHFLIIDVFYAYVIDRKCCTSCFRVASTHKDYEALNFPT